MIIDRTAEVISRRLTPKQRLFCLEYMVDMNATQAYIRAFGKKRNPHVATSLASRLLTDENVRGYLSHAVTVKTQKLDQDAERVLMELARLSYSDLGQAFRADGSFLPLAEMPEDVRRCISGIEVEEEWETRFEDGSGKAGDELEPVLVRTTIRKLKFWDKNKALELIAKAFKLITNNTTNVNVSMSLETLVMQSLEQKDGKPAALDGTVVPQTQLPQQLPAPSQATAPQPPSDAT